MNPIIRVTLAVALAACATTLPGVLSAQPASSFHASGNETYAVDAAELEQIALDAGIVQIKKIKYEQRLAEVEGHDAQHRKVKLTVDRNTGETLRTRIKDKTHQH